MSHHSLSKLLAAALCCLAVQAAYCGGRTKHVILITIDGMRPEMVTDSTMPTPNLKRMRAGGFFVNRIKGVTPTATYPSHTTIITGVEPARHNIYYNSRFNGNSSESAPYWWADSIKSPTIWDAAARNGMSVASLFWPVSTGARSVKYNIPEFWANKPVPNQLEYIKPWCTPEGLLDELEREATGRLTHENFGAGSMTREAKEAAMANYIMNRYCPQLMTIHLITTDYAQHDTGKESYRTRAAVGGADHAIGLILENLERHHLMDSTTVIVCGDHGFVNCTAGIAPNAWLVQEGLLSAQPDGPWKALFHRAGAMGFLYLKDRKDSRTLKKIERKLASLPDSVRSLFRVMNHDELVASQCDPEAALAIEPVPGVTVVGARTGADVVPQKGGKHGYKCGCDPTTLVAFGSGVEHGNVPVMNQTDIAPMVLKLLGISF